LLPTTESLLRPAVVNNDAVVEDIRLRCSNAKYYHDKQAKPLPELQIGQTVKLQPGQRGGTWKKVTIDKLGTQSYQIQTDNGAMYRQNRKFIRAVPDPTEEQEGSSTDQTGTVPSPVLEVPQEGESLELSPPEKAPDEEGQEVTVNFPVKHTASGRIVKEPTRYKDYVRH